jgi:hypothetical protein
VTETFHFRLPDWPAQRLVKEAVCSYGLRHLSEPAIDVQTAPWPKIRQLIFAFLRHRHSEFDERLRLRCEHDPAFRDDLAAQVAAAAYRKYPWLGKDDPRPFPETDSDSIALPFDALASDLADMHTMREHLLSAMRDLKRQGNHKCQIALMQAELTKIQSEIERAYSFLSAPKHVKDTGKVRSFLWTFPTENYPADQYHFVSRVFAENRVEYIGFRGPCCGVSVARWKQIVPFGQGYRCSVYACYCFTFAIHTPGRPGRLKRVGASHWEKFCSEKSVREEELARSAPADTGARCV